MKQLKDEQERVLIRIISNWVFAGILVKYSTKISEWLRILGIDITWLVEEEKRGRENVEIYKTANRSISLRAVIVVGIITRYIYLVAENADAAGAANLIGPEPHSGQTGWNGQDEGLTDRYQTLAEERDPEAIGRHAEHLYPRAEARAERPEDYGVPETLKSHPPYGFICTVYICTHFICTLNVVIVAASY